MSTSRSSEEGRSMFYLTVQDVLWINLQVTKRVNRYEYAKLEEAVYYQYSYGVSQDLLGQAARFLSGFIKLAPLSAGNEATAFIGCLAYLKINGYVVETQPDQAASWVEKARSGQALDLIRAGAKVDPEGHEHDVRPDVRECVTALLEQYAEAIPALGGVTPIQHDPERVNQVTAKMGG